MVEAGVEEKRDETGREEEGGRLLIEGRSREIHHAVGERGEKMEVLKLVSEKKQKREGGGGNMSGWKKTNLE